MYGLPWDLLLSPVMLYSPTTFDLLKCAGDHWIRRNTNIITATHTTINQKGTLAKVKRFRKETDILLYRWYVFSFPAEKAESRGRGFSSQLSFIREGFAPRSNPLPFYIPFLTEKGILSYTLMTNGTPFTFLSYNFASLLTTVDALSFKCE